MPGHLSTNMKAPERAPVIPCSHGQGRGRLNDHVHVGTAVTVWWWGSRLAPSTENFSVLRALRVLRVLRLITTVPQMRRVVGGLLSALPGLGSVVAILCLVFYVAGVMATQLFGDDFPQWFGTLWRSLYSLFQIMTLESWSMGIVRPVMEVHPYAWGFFVPFILIATFTMLNLFIGVVVSAMQSYHDAEAQHMEGTRTEHAELLAEVRALRADLQALKSERGEG